MLPEAARSDTEPVVRGDWIGYENELSPGRWRRAGTFTVAGPDAKPMAPRLVLRDDGVEQTGAGTMLLGDPTTRQMYEVEMDKPSLVKLSAILEAAGYAEPDGDESPELEVGDELVEKGGGAEIPTTAIAWVLAAVTLPATHGTSS